MGQINLYPEDIQSWEAMLLEATGCHTSIMQVGVFVLSCGCTEGALMLHGLSQDVLLPDLGQKVFDKFEKSGMRGEIVYASLFPGLSGVNKLASRVLCNKCRQVVEIEKALGSATVIFLIR